MDRFFTCLHVSGIGFRHSLLRAWVWDWLLPCDFGNHQDLRLALVLDICRLPCTHTPITIRWRIYLHDCRKPNDKYCFYKYHLETNQKVNIWHVLAANNPYPAHLQVPLWKTKHVLHQTNRVPPPPMNANALLAVQAGSISKGYSVQASP